MSQTISVAAGATAILAGDVRDVVSLGGLATLELSAGTQLSLFAGAVASGSATISIDSGAALFAPGPLSAAITIVLRGAGSLLQLDGSTVTGFAATIAALVPGAVIDVSGVRITSLVRRGLSAGKYGLVLMSDLNVLGTLSIGSGLPATIIAVPDGIDGTRLITGPSIATPAGAAVLASGSSDAFTWIGGSPGTWATIADWVTPSGPATRAPGPTDNVTLSSSTLRLMPVSGSGAAAAVETTGVVAWAGPLSTGGLLAGTGLTDALILTSGAVVVAASATVRQGVMSVQGAKLSVAGLLTVNGTLDAINAGTISAGSLLMGGGEVRLSANSGLLVGTAASWHSGVFTVAADGLVRGSGTITASVALAGTIEVDGVLSLFGPLTGRGTIEITSGSTLFATGGLDQSTVIFSPGATLEVFGAATVGLLSGFGADDCLQLAGNYPGVLVWTPASVGGTLDLGAFGVVAVDLAPDLNPALVTFQEGPDGLGGTAITEIPCFTAATRLRTPSGWIAAGSVQPRSWLATASGAARRVTWVGRTTIAGWRRGAAPQLDPVCVRADAFAPGRPVVDVALSPLHGIRVDTSAGVRLVPAIALHDGVLISRLRCSESLEYVHVGLDRHDSVLAEGLPCESFLPHGPDARGQFTLTLGSRPRPVTAFAPRLEHGYMLELLRDALGFAKPTVGPVPTSGNLDLTEGKFAHGWAVGSRCMDVLLDGVVAGRVICNQWRSDLEAASKNGGHAAFTTILSASRSKARLALQPVQC